MPFISGQSDDSRELRDRRSRRGVGAGGPVRSTDGGGAAAASAPRTSLVRTCEATLRSSEAFGSMVVAEARRRKFFAAQCRAFPGDGGTWIWTVHRNRFRIFKTIIDLLNIFDHVYLAAKAAGGSADVVWERYVARARACWQGRVADTSAPCRELPDTMPPPDGQEVKPTDPREIIGLTIGSLTNHATRIDYRRYRRDGVPMVSGLVESLVKLCRPPRSGSREGLGPGPGGGDRASPDSAPPDSSGTAACWIT